MTLTDILKLIAGAAFGVIILAGALQLLVVAALAAGIFIISSLVYFMFKKDD